MSCRTPHGVRGLKFTPKDGCCGLLYSRTPHGVRGLKYGKKDGVISRDLSHPSWGAWIEMDGTGCQPCRAVVAPLMGCVD